MSVATAAFVMTRNAKKQEIRDATLIENIRDQIHRLNDVNTQIEAADTLKAIINDLTPEQFIPFINLLRKFGPSPRLKEESSHSSSTPTKKDGNQGTNLRPNTIKTGTRKEFVKLFSCLAVEQSSQTSLCIARIISMLVPWVSDLEEVVREAAADAFGNLTRIVFPLTSAAQEKSNMSVLIKPLMQNLASPIKTTKHGSSLALARIFSNGNSTGDKHLSRFIDRIAPSLNSRLDNLRDSSGATLWVAAINLMIATGNDFLPFLLSYLSSSLNICIDTSVEWQTIESSLRFVASIATHFSSSKVITPLKIHVLEELEKVRYHKVNPVREAAVNAINNWKEKVNGPDIASTPQNTTRNESTVNTFTSSIDMTKVRTKPVNSPLRTSTQTIKSPSQNLKIRKSPLERKRPDSAPVKGRRKVSNTSESSAPITIYEPRPPTVQVEKDDAFEGTDAGGDSALPVSDEVVDDEVPFVPSIAEKPNVDSGVVFQLEKLVNSQKKILSELSELRSFTVTRLEDFEKRLSSIEKKIEKQPTPVVTSVRNGFEDKQDLLESLKTNSLFDMNLAYSKVLQLNDDLQLIRLMTRTGPCLKQLNINLQQDLWKALIKMLNGHNFVDQILPWIKQQVTECNTGNVGANKNLLTNLSQILYKLAASPDSMGVEAARLHSVINK